MIDIWDLRSLGYDKVFYSKIWVNTTNLSLQTLYVSTINKFLNALKKEKEDTKRKIPWLDRDNERKYMTKREILDKYIDLDKSCLKDTEKKEVRDMLYEYKDAFSLRDEIGTCPNIEIENRCHR